MLSVSCLMVTKDRFDCFLRSFACYCRQDYPAKELVVAVHGAAQYARSITDCVEAAGRRDVRVLSCPAHLKLGELRNLALREASGPLVCQWDDDDLYHPQRLSRHIEFLNAMNLQASFLTEQLQFFADTRQLFWCNWSARGTDPRYYLIPNTLLAYKDAVPPYPSDAERLEDQAVRDAIFYSSGRVAGLGNCPYLTVYTYHGRNVYDRAHHMSLVVKRGLGVSAIRAHLPVLRRELHSHQPLGPYSICGMDGGAPRVVARIKG
jgi:glycosyltransferase involved in cell wall biosynthesis